MTDRFRRTLREPLVHFLALGALLFVIHGLVSDDRLESELGSTIDMNAREIDFLQANFVRQWNRPPTVAELTSLVDNRLREEVLFREALAMGLDADDVIIRRRLVQKLDFLAEDIALQADPTEADLGAFLDENLERYEMPPLRTFSHIYFSTDYREDAAADAAALLSTTDQATVTERASELGDRSMLPADFQQRSPTELAQQLGSSFAEALFELEPIDAWQGPIASSFGVHLVRITEHQSARPPEWSEVERRVRTDYETLRRDRANEQFYESLLARYEVIVDQDAIRAGSIQPVGNEPGR